MHIVQVFMFVLISYVAFGQTTSDVEGVVRDATGAAVPGAAITAKEVETSAVHRAETDGQGLFRFNNLPPGMYRLAASKQGFKTAVHPEVLLEVGRAAGVDLDLEVGIGSETTIVVGDLPLLSASAADWGGGTERQTLNSIPLNGRDLFELAAAQKASTVTNVNRIGFVGGFGTAMSLNGGRPNQNGFQIDGIHMNDATGLPPISAAGRLLGIESIQELNVVSSPFSAEYGRAAAAVITAISKSGGNQWHGSAYEYFRDDALDARNFFDSAALGKAPFRRNQFGGSLSGPIVKDRLFFLINPESLRQTNNVPASAATPTAAARVGSLGPVSAVIQPYLALFPLPNGRDYGDGTGAYTTLLRSTASENYISGKMDVLLSPRWRTSVRGAYDRSSAEIPDTYGFFDFQNRTHNEFLHSDTQFVSSPSVLHNFRAGISRNWNFAVPNVDPDIPASLSFIPGQPLGVLQVTGLLDSGGNRAVISRLLLATTDAQVHYEMSWVHGRHSLKAGGGFSYVQINPSLDVNRRGLYVFSSLAGFLRGSPVAANVTNPGSIGGRSFGQEIGDAWVQYEMRLSSSLTLSAGVRYEPYTAPRERHDGLATLSFAAARTGDVLTGGPLYRNPSALNFAPRLGLAWKPEGSSKTVVRVGFGIFHDILGATTYAGNRALSPSQYQNRTLVLPTFPNLTAALAASTTAPSISMVDYDVQQPYMMQQQVSLEHQLGQSSVIRLGYSGTRGVHLAGLVGDINPPPPQVLANEQLYFAPGTPQINPKFLQIGMLRTQFNLFYHALNAAYERKWSNGLRTAVRYTFAKTIDETSDVLFQDFEGSDKVPNMFNYRANRGPSDYDIRQALAWNWSYALTLKAARGWRSVASDWQLHGLMQAQAGHPFSPSVGFDRAGFHSLDDLGQRPDLVPGVTQILGGPDRYFNPLAFSLPAAGTLGNLGRNVLIGPGLFTLDAALHKSIIRTERYAVTLRLEGFNVTNRPNFQLPSYRALFSSSGSRLGTAGQITTTTTPARQMQLALRLDF